jgi:hypothetical protein
MTAKIDHKSTEDKCEQQPTEDYRSSFAERKWGMDALAEQDQPGNERGSGHRKKHVPPCRCNPFSPSIRPPRLGNPPLDHDQSGEPPGSEHEQ